MQDRERQAKKKRNDPPGVKHRTGDDAHRMNDYLDTESFQLAPQRPVLGQEDQRIKAVPSQSAQQAQERAAGTVGVGIMMDIKNPQPAHTPQINEQPGL